MNKKIICISVLAIFAMTSTANGMIDLTGGRGPAAPFDQNLNTGNNVEFVDITSTGNLYVEKELEVDGNITITENITAKTFYGNGVIPIGGIIMWSGTLTNLYANYSNWQICDGTNGTPDLGDRFIVGSGSNYSVGDKGGANNVTLITSQMPSHTHNITDPTHGHRTLPRCGVSMGFSTGFVWNIADYVSAYKIVSSTTGITLDNTGGASAHENRPPYYSLAYIMRLE